MTDLNPQTIDRLKRFQSSEKFSQLNPQTQKRLTKFVSGNISKVNPLVSAIQSAEEVSRGGFKRQFQAGPTSFNTITGGPSTEFAHGLKSELLSRSGVPEDVNIGGIHVSPTEILSTSTDPQSLLGGLGASSSSIAKLLRNIAGKKLAKSSSIVERILPPESGRLAESIRKGGELPEINIPARAIKTAPTYTKLTEQLQKGIEPFRVEREAILQSKTLPIKKYSFKNLSEAIKDELDSPQGAVNANKMEKVLDRELESIMNIPREKFRDPKFLESKKEYYQNLASNLLNKRGVGRLTGTEAAQHRAYLHLADDYKSMVESVDPRIAELNRQMQGRILSSKTASKLAERERTRPLETLPQEIVEGTRGSKSSTFAAVFRGIAKQIPVIRRLFPTLKSETKAIERLSRSAAKKIGRAERLESLFKPSLKPSLKILASGRRKNA